MFFGFVLLGISVGLGAVAITKVQEIEVESFANTDELVIPYLLTSARSPGSTLQYTYAKAAGIYMIAPLDIAYQVNEDIVNIKYSETAGNVPPISMVLDCGNGDRNNPSQKVEGKGYINGDNPFFDSSCLYTQKGTYTPTITFTYRDPVRQQNQSFTLDAGTVTINSQMNITSDGQPLSTNSTNSELIVGDAPVRVQIDAKNIFSELGIPDNNIIWDMESDGTPDKENKVTFGYNYYDPQLYTVSYRFPTANENLSNLWYHMYLRVNQSDTPRCTIVAENNGNSYEFSAVWSGGASAASEVNSYRWEIYNIDTETTVQSIPTRSDQLEYTFREQGNYTARLNFSTIDDAKGICESDVVNAGAPTYEIGYSLFYKKPGQSSYNPFPATGLLAKDGDKVIIDSLPIDLQVRVNEIRPQPASATLTMRLDDAFMIKKSATVFETTVSKKNDHTITIRVQDEQGTTVDKTITVSLNQSVIQ